MKKIMLISLLVISMLVMVGFTPVETSYWENVKEMYEWDAIEGESQIELRVVTPDVNYQYKIHMHTESNLKDLSTYTEIKVEDVNGLQDIPTIKTYTHDSDLYINQEAALALLSAIGIEEAIDLQEEYLVLESGTNNVDMDANVLNDVIEFVEDMDLGIELGMVQDGDVYTLTLESDKLIDLLDEYIRYILVNIDQLPDSFMKYDDTITITEEEKQIVLQQYNAFAATYKDIAKEFIAGSKYYHQSTFGEGEYSQNAEVVINTPMGQLDMKTISTSIRLDSSNIQLPESVMRITEEELNELMMRQFIPEIDMNSTGLKAIIDLDGYYLKFGEYDLEEGKIQLKIEEGTSYITAEDAYDLLDFEIKEEILPIRELENYGFYVEWNPENATIEIYK